MKKLNFFQNRPKATRIDVEAYLKRIGIAQEVPSLTYLKALQKAHLISIPFENLDIHYRSKVILDYQKIFNKVVVRGRGGFCYELNGLFYHLLYHLGFDCYVISAQVRNDKTEQFGRPFDHMAILVNLNDHQWLVDVGFGDGPVSPLKISIGEVQMDYTRYWRMDTDPDENIILKVSGDTNYYESKYLFTTEEKQLIQFLEMCEYHQNSADSPFTQKKLATRLTANGRVTLSDRHLKILELGEISEMDILHEDEFLSKLEQHFSISHQQLIPKEEQ
ncbi:arylamine N-acetyltransferase family protein [Ekhidna sp. To15]|uniref:arylamine N-acetyltransferase family protein n=1 Tax=Ekhidna sp. To15 TaxID=3395267 RepID=UPI003F523EF1